MQQSPPLLYESRLYREDQKVPTYVLDSVGDVVSSRLDRDVLVAIKVDAGRAAGAEEFPLHPLVARQRDRPVLRRRASRRGSSLKALANRATVC